MNKELLKGIGSWTEIFFLCFFAFIGYVVAILITALTPVFIWPDMNIQELVQSPSFMRMGQAIAAICVFLAPALVFSYLFRNKVSQFLKINKPNSSIIVILVILLVTIIQPFVNSMGYLNEQIHFPEFLSSVEEWMRAKEESAKSIVNLCFSDRGGLTYILNILIIAVLAGIAEELFFRGCLQQILGKIFSNKHLVIWITAFVFSAVHLQFYGFLPRLLLGAMLGYLFVWSGSMWVPVLAHILNNAIIVSYTHLYLGTPQYDNIQNIGREGSIWISILSFIGTFCVLTVIYRRSKK